MTENHPLGITLVTVLMFIFGVAEVATGFTHNFLGLIFTAPAKLATYGASGIGALYALAGLLLIMRKQTARPSLACLVVVIICRISVVISGLYPANSFLQTFSIIMGKAITIVFAIYIGLKSKSFE